MPRLRLAFLVCLAMTAFAGNSLLCRLALKHTAIDAASFTAVRLLSGALMLWLVVRLRGARALRSTATASAAAGGQSGNWLSAAALFVYAAGFSFAYVSMSAATGALLLFGAVQATMMADGLWRGERLRGTQWAGVAIALAGLVHLMLPGLVAPTLAGAVSMTAAGMAWGVYSLRGKQRGVVAARGLPAETLPVAADPTRVTANNFLRTVPMALLLSALTAARFSPDATGTALAVLSGALASGLGYALWYQALPALKATHAATVQLSVPVIAAIGGTALLGETLTGSMVLAATAILGGMALVILERR